LYTYRTRTGIFLLRHFFVAQKADGRLKLLMGVLEGVLYTIPEDGAASIKRKRENLEKS
jgi:hypothetical protein